MDKILLNNLKKVYKEHSSLIVGVDFDDTIFPFTKGLEERCKHAAGTLLRLKKKMGIGLIICLYSVADRQSLIYKEHIMELYGIGPDYINEGPLDDKWNSKKPYFNILLDDKAGLDSTLETLNRFIDEI